MAKRKKSYFKPELFDFFRDLAENNDRDWFKRNKERFETTVRDPFLDFIVDFSGPLEKISPHFQADPRPQGGSLFRIYRDTRFSKDKSPYKTHAGAQFRHAAGKKVHAPGFYLHLEPGSVFAGAGMWRPERKALEGVRDAISENPDQWKKIVTAKPFMRDLTVGGQSLKRPPRGYDPDHPLVEELKRKDFIVSRSFTEKQACAPGFMQEVAKSFRTMGPYVRFLTEAVGLPF